MTWTILLCGNFLIRWGGKLHPWFSTLVARNRSAALPDGGARLSDRGIKTALNERASLLIQGLQAIPSEEISTLICLLTRGLSPFWAIEPR